MDFVIGIVKAIVYKAAEYTVDPLKTQIGYMFNNDTKVQNLKNQVEKLAGERRRVLHRVQAAERKWEMIEEDVNKWLDEVNEKVAQGVEKAMEDEEKEKKKCLIGLFPNLKSRYQFGKKVEQEAKVVARLLEQGKFDEVSYPVAPPGIGTLPVKGFEAFESRKTTLEGIMESLKDSTITTIGVHGMPGVGKTMLVRGVARKAREEQLFDEVTMATISQNPNFRNVQGEIAEGLHLEFDEKTESGRARLLYHRLRSTGKKVLVILEDIWTRLDLDAIGVSLEDDNNFSTVRSKILLTSRNQGVLDRMSIGRKFEVRTSCQEEAMALFAKTVGDTVENPGYLPIVIKLLENVQVYQLLFQ
ncbi:hypothetical protein REPUB_Repub04eG0108100 [Reevesia pubescens]